MIVVALGHRLTSPEIHSHLRGRVDTAVDAFHSTDATHLVCSGGRRNETVDRTESAVMYAHARTRGVSPERLLAEDRSVDTIGNAYFTRRLVDRREFDFGTILLVTSATHVERAAFAFGQCFPDSKLDTAFVYEPTGSDQSEDTADARDRLERTREFFDPIRPGDCDAIAQRLVTEHDCYGPADISSARSSARST